MLASAKTILCSCQEMPGQPRNTQVRLLRMESKNDTRQRDTQQCLPPLSLQWTLHARTCQTAVKWSTNCTVPHHACIQEPYITLTALHLHPAVCHIQLVSALS